MDKGKARASLKKVFQINGLGSFDSLPKPLAAKNFWFTLVFVASQRQAMTASPAFDELVF